MIYRLFDIGEGPGLYSLNCLLYSAIGSKNNGLKIRINFQTLFHELLPAHVAHPLVRQEKVNFSLLILEYLEGI